MTDPLRRLLDQLLRADDEQHRLVPDTPEYQDVSRRIDRLVRQVWDARSDDAREPDAKPSDHATSDW